MNKTNIHAIRNLIEGDRRRTVWGIAVEVEISYGRARLFSDNVLVNVYGIVKVLLID